MTEEPGVVSPQLRSFSPDIFFLDISALRDSTSDSLFAPDERIHDAQHPQCQKKKTHQHDFHIWPAFLSLNEYFTTHCEDCIFISTSCS
jgi:hypothetical protein